MMNQLLPCLRNPQLGGTHCYHSHFSSGGYKSVCCWCGEDEPQEDKVPAHGQFMQQAWDNG